MIEVLQYIPSFAFGGIESFVLNMNEELKEKFHFTYLVEVDINEEMKQKIKSYGADIIRIKNLTKESFFKNLKQIRNIIRNGKYDVVHVHGCDIRFFVMFFAKIYGVKKRIYHLHSARIERHEKIKKIFMNINILLSNCLIACSKEAVEKMCPQNIKNAIILKNAINIQKYKFDSKARQNIRDELKINNNDIVIGNVGRIVEVKNQQFLIDIVERYLLKNKNIRLLLVGEGELKENLKKMAEDKKILNYIYFVGERQDTFRYYSAMDIFCLPSLCEGLGMVLIEAQANGLQCIASLNVPTEANVTGNVEFLGIGKKDIDKWIETIEKNAKKRYHKNDLLINAGYNIKESANKLAELYVTKGGKL